MSEQIKDGGPAFPCEQHEAQDNTWNQTFESGMTLRDYFAARALPAIYKDYWEGVRLHEFDCNDETWPTSLALDAYRMADAMLLAREAKS
jgi:hypothetical protein